MSNQLKHYRIISQLRTKRSASLLAFVAAFAAVGAVLLALSHASTPVASVEAESGTPAGGASIVSDSAASGGQAVRFGSASGTYSCVDSSQYGLCQYSNVSYMTGCTSPYTGQNIWAGGASYHQTLYSNSPKDWYIVANANTNWGGVQAYPNAGCHMPVDANGNGRTIDSYSSITSSWNVTIPTDNTKVAGWAAYDLWFNNDDDEVFIATTLVANSNYDCAGVATITVSGIPWHMCDFGTERVWKPGTDDQHLVSRTSGSVDIKAILVWMENNGKLPANSVWTTNWGSASYGFEVCDTHGTDQIFRVNDFSWAAN